MQPIYYSIIVGGKIMVKLSLLLVLCFVIATIVMLTGCSENIEEKKENSNNFEITWEELKLQDETIVIKPGQVHYYGGTYESPQGKNTKYHYIVTSSVPVEIYVVASESDFNLIGTGRSFVEYPSCGASQVLRYDRECTISSEGGIATFNKNNVDATVSLKVSYFRPKFE